MKKYYIFILFFVIFLSACQKNTYLEMDFNQAVSIFSQQADYLLNSMEDWGLN
jgi:type III secretory pathway lipoprotein EscJ